MNVVVLVPVLARPHRVEPVVRSIADSGAPARALFIASPGDSEEIVALDTAGVDYLLVDGGYAAKINAGVRATTEPLIFLGADDLHFHPGWYDAATARLGEGVAVVGTNDLGNPRVVRGTHATHSLLTREYAERGSIDDPTVVLHEGYDHNFVDDEFVGTARHRRAFAHAADAVVEHLHPNWGKASGDSTYVRGLSGFARDQRLFRTRRRLWR